MTRSIWKHKLSLDDETHALPGFVVHVEPAENPYANFVTVWTDVDDTSAPTMHFYRTFGTGHPIPANATNHVGSVVSGPFVWHVVEMSGV